MGAPNQRVLSQFSERMLIRNGLDSHQMKLYCEREDLRPLHSSQEYTARYNIYWDRQQAKRAHMGSQAATA